MIGNTHHCVDKARSMTMWRHQIYAPVSHRDIYIAEFRQHLVAFLRLKTLAQSFRSVPMTTSDMGVSRSYSNAHGLFYFLCYASLRQAIGLKPRSL